MAKCYQIKAAAAKHGRSRRVKGGKHHVLTYAASSKFQPYIQRNRILREMGYSDYGDYLRSPLWNRIRESALRRASNRCYACGASSRLQVHHKDYRYPTLAGTYLEGLIVLCATCHENAEKSTDGTKSSLIAVNKKIERMKSSRD